MGRINAYVFSFASGTGGQLDVDDGLNTSVRLVRGTMGPEFLIIVFFDRALA